MKLTVIDPIANYDARVRQLEQEYLNHQMLQAEIKNNPAITGDEETKALEDSQKAVLLIENAHTVALNLLAQAKAGNDTPKGDDSTENIAP